MSRILLADPFWLPLGDVRRLTDRQKWELYIRPAVIRQRESDGAPPEPHDEDVIACDDGRELSPEQFMRMLAGKGVVDAATVEANIAAAQAQGGE